jgi:hypothetical protein
VVTRQAIPVVGTLQGLPHGSVSRGRFDHNTPAKAGAQFPRGDRAAISFMLLR